MTKRMGRPPGINYPVARTMLLTEDDLAVLVRIAVAWKCSKAEAVRRMIRAEDKKRERRQRRDGRATKPP